MKALAICPSGIDIDFEAIEEALGLQSDIEQIVPAWLSAFTAMKIAKTDADVFITSRISDAIAAISARKISKNPSSRIICIVAPNTQPPKGIPSEVKAGVDMWIFSSERLKNLFPADLKNVSVIPPRAEEIEHATDNKHYIWLGPIDGNTERLKAAIEAVNAMEDGAMLTICGQGKAQNVMPCVRLSRSIEHPERIVWADPEADVIAIAKTCCAVWQSGLDPIKSEMILGSAPITNPC